MTVYLDAIFLLNVLFDGCILLLVVLLTKQSISMIRLLMGALYAASSVFFVLGSLAVWFANPMIKLIFSFGMIIVTFYPFSLRRGIQLFLTLYMVTFFLGGFLIGLNYFFNQSMWLENGAVLTKNGGYGEPMSWIFVCTVFPIACWMYIKNDNHRKVEKLQAQSLYICEFQFDHFAIRCKGLLDTGNQLADPLTNRPVVILDGSQFEKEIPNDLFQKVVNSHEGTEVFDETWILYRLIWIPYRSLGKKNGRVIGIEAKQLRVMQAGEEKIFNHVLVGFAPETLHTEAFSCILHPNLWIENDRKMMINRGTGK